MKRKVSLLLISIILTIFSFIFFLTRIERVPFETDEAYWVSTGKIIPILVQGRFSDPFWQEYYGFTNFNGAKYIFGLGLALLGHTESEINEAGVAPYTYYHWLPDEGKVLPQNHILFSLVRDARIISAFFAAISIGLMVIASFLLFQNLFLSSTAAIILFAHPILQHVAVRALADSFFLCFIMLFLCGVLRIVKQKKRYQHLLASLGIVIAYLMIIKVNGAMFLFAFSVSLVLFSLIDSKNFSIRKSLLTIALTSVTAVIIFFLLQPNLFFFPQYSLFQMIEDRAMITQQHIQYFSRVNPAHVTISLLARIHSLLHHLFPLWFIPLFIFGVVSSILRRKKNLAYPFIICMGIIVIFSVLSYTVFDEIRYFLPILPFVVLASVHFLQLNKN